MNHVHLHWVTFRESECSYVARSAFFNLAELLAACNRSSCTWPGSICVTAVNSSQRKRKMKVFLSIEHFDTVQGHGQAPWTGGVEWWWWNFYLHNTFWGLCSSAENTALLLEADGPRSQSLLCRYQVSTEGAGPLINKPAWICHCFSNPLQHRSLQSYPQFLFPCLTSPRHSWKKGGEREDALKSYKWWAAAQK